MTFMEVIYWAIAKIPGGLVDDYTASSQEAEINLRKVLYFRFFAVKKSLY